MTSSELQGLLAMLVELLADVQASRAALPATSRRHSNDLLRASMVNNTSSSSLSSSVVYLHFTHADLVAGVGRLSALYVCVYVHISAL